MIQPLGVEEKPLPTDANNLKMEIVEISDSEELARRRVQAEQVNRNLDWMQANWPYLSQIGLGKFVAVAEQEAFVADTAREAFDRAVAAHPEDKGVLVQYLNPAKGPRIYAHRGEMG